MLTKLSLEAIEWKCDLINKLFTQLGIARPLLRPKGA